VANLDDNRQRLFFLAEPYTFHGGEKLELKALTSAGIYRTEDLFLLAEKPEPRQPSYTISEVEARCTVSGASASAAFTWITNWPASSTVEYRASAGAPIRRRITA